MGGIKLSEGIGSPEKAGFTDNALAVLEKRYLRKDGSGKVIETAYEMFWRVAKNIALMDVLYYPGISAKGEDPGGLEVPGDPKARTRRTSPGNTWHNEHKHKFEVSQWDWAALKMAYGRLAAEGQVKATWDEVKSVVESSVDSLKATADEFYHHMVRGEFMPNSQHS